MLLEIEKDARLDTIYKKTITGTLTSILVELEELNLVKPIWGNDWKPKYPLTEDGFYLIGDAIQIGLGLIFRHSKINLPNYQHFDENNFTELLLKNAGLPQVRSDTRQNEIEINFNGPTPLIKNIRSYLNPKRDNATHVKNIEINKIYLIIESSDRLN